VSHSDDVGCRRLIGQLQVYSLLVLVLVAGSGCCCASGRGADLGRFQGILSLGPRRVRRPAHNSGGRRCRSFGDDGADRTLNGSPRLTSLLIGSDCFVSKEKRDQGQADQTGHKEQVRNPLTPRTHPTLA
jgi:hypothetical protein